MKVLVLSITLLIQTLLVSSSILPKKFPEPCSKSLPNYKECKLAYFEKIKPYIINGVPELNIPSLNPLQLDELVVNRTVNEQMSYSTRMLNVRMWGLDETQLLKYDFDPEDLEGEFTIRIPYIKTKTDYDMVANMFGGQIINSGKFKGYTTNVVVNIYLRLKRVNRKGVEYFTVDDLSMKSHIGDSEMKITSSDPVFQPIFDRLITYYNQDHDRVLRLMEPVFSETATTFLRPIIENILSVIPADEIMLD